MASRFVPGLYVIGEMLDCDGRIGGFNFQWAWATGYLAGHHAALGTIEKKTVKQQTHMSQYIFDNKSEEREFRRLQLVEAANDPTTIALLEETGIQPGWLCLELGAGAGSILRWMGHRVGPKGLAVGVDKKTTYLHDFAFPPFQIHQGTFLDVSLSHSFELIHGRYILIHNQSDMDILHKMFSLLKPGGWAIFEEPDFTSTRLLDHSLEIPRARVNEAICQMFVNASLDPGYALHLPPKTGASRFSNCTNTIHHASVLWEITDGRCYG